MTLSVRSKTPPLDVLLRQQRAELIYPSSITYAKTFDFFGESCVLIFPIRPWRILPSRSSVPISPAFQSERCSERAFLWSFVFDLGLGFWSATASNTKHIRFRRFLRIESYASINPHYRENLYPRYTQVCHQLWIPESLLFLLSCTQTCRLNTSDFFLISAHDRVSSALSNLISFRIAQIIHNLYACFFSAVLIHCRSVK